MMAFFDFIFPSKTLNKSDCESQVVSDLNSNTMNENNIEQEKTTDSAKNNSVEDLELPFQSLFSNEDEINNSIKTSTPAKNQNGSANKSARRKSNRRRQNNKFMNSMSSETASEISINTDNSSNLDLSQVVTSTPQNTRAMRARKLMAHNVVNDMDDALNVIRLMSDEELTEEEAVFQVTGYTKKVQCPICCLSFERNEIETMLSCNHECCTSCAKNHFTEQIRNKSLKFCVCFACDEPKWLSCDIAVSSEKVTDYFGMMDIVLRRLLDTDVHDIFQNKLRDFSLAKEDNFKWCSNCSFGYFIDKTSKVKFVICENCEFVSCINCSLEWKSQHEKIDCEQFKQWLEDNDENLHKNTVKKYIEQNGIVCPKCKFQYILSRGGCMHFTCNQCKHEFCNGCNNPFYRDASKCQTSYCKSLGLHAHHPKNCYFYLRDKEPADLKRLLLNNKIDFLSVCEDVKKCPIPLQKEDNGVLYDEICNEDVVSTNQAGFCQKHYIEYLAQLIFKNNIDCSSLTKA